MKNASIFSAKATLVAAFFFFSSFNLFSQDKREPIKPYKEDGYSLQEVIDFALDSTSKAKEFRIALMSVLEPVLRDTFQKLGKKFSEDYLQVVLQKCQSEEVSLKPGEWDNSGRNKKTRKIEFFSGGDWEGFAWVFRWGKIRVPLLKQSCMNVMKTKKEAQKSAPKQEENQPSSTEEPMVWVQLWYVRYLFGGTQNVGTWKQTPPVFKQVRVNDVVPGVPLPIPGVGGDYSFWRIVDPNDLRVYLESLKKKPDKKE